MVEPPGPIPNPEVKHCCADGSGAIGPVRVGRCQVYARLLLNGRSRAFLCLFLRSGDALVPDLPIADQPRSDSWKKLARCSARQEAGDEGVATPYLKECFFQFLQ